MSLSKVLSVARGELGNCEDPPGSNMTKYGADYGLNGVPYCAEFLWWVFNKAGERMAYFGGGKTASCDTLLRWYKEQGLTVDVSEIRVGDILILNFSGTKETQHCGLVESKGESFGTWYTIEGNTSPGLEGSQSDGGCVALKLRSIKNVVGVCRPQYKEEEMITDKPPDYIGTWSEKYFEWAIRIGLVSGYEDGSFRPNAYPTRAELLAILYRYDEYRFGNSEIKK